MQLKAPQIIMAVLYILSLGISMAKHGEDRPPYSFPSSLIALVINVAMLWWGGFWG